MSHAIRVEPRGTDRCTPAHAAAPGTWDTGGDWVEVARVHAAPDGRSADRLATVIQLDAYRSAAVAPSRGTYLRRRAMVALGLLAAVLALVLLAGGSTAQADLEHAEVAGRATIAPGETLWDVAAATSPDDVDTRVWLDRIRELNGLGTGPVAAWTVVLLPAG